MITIHTPVNLQRSIQRHYDRCSWWYERLWGEHLHHGYFKDNEPVELAQVRLLERLAQAVEIPDGAKILDAGCGVGGSCLWLASRWNCHITGVTLSLVQARMAQKKVIHAGHANRVTIHHADLEALTLPASNLDVLWSVECLEHLHDKPGFLAKAAHWLRPGGRIALCLWTPSENVTVEQRRCYLEPICQGFLCPSLASANQYGAWLEQIGLRVEEQSDLTEEVVRTWEICLKRTRKRWIKIVASLLGRETRRFLRSFPIILDAYRTGALRYSLLVGRKPENPD